MWSAIVENDPDLNQGLATNNFKDAARNGIVSNAPECEPTC